MIVSEAELEQFASDVICSMRVDSNVASALLDTYRQAAPLRAALDVYATQPCVFAFDATVKPCPDRRPGEPDGWCRPCWCRTVVAEVSA